MAISSKSKTTFRFYCTLCGWEIITENWEDWTMQVCPNCKAKLSFEVVSTTKPKYSSEHPYPTKH